LSSLHPHFCVLPGGVRALCQQHDCGETMEPSAGASSRASG
jgi:hypothetical protein